MKRILIVIVALGVSLWCNPSGEMDTAASKSNPIVKLKTNHGEIELLLHADKAPITVENFLAYVDSGFYEGTVFHRVIPGFMIQGGGFTPELEQKPTREAIKNEADNGLRNLRATVAMARRPPVHSATSQFYINLVDNRALDHGVRDFGYAVFGRVVGGMEIVDKIAQVKTGVLSGMPNVPEQGVIIESVSVVKDSKTAKKP